MQNILKSAVAVGLLSLAVSLYAGWIIPNAAIDRTSAGPGQDVAFQRDGTAELDIAWTEAVLWYPNSTPPLNLGNAGVTGNGFRYYGTPFPSGEKVQAIANGQHAIQYRLVDVNYDYVDQWLYFNGINFGGGGE